MEQKYKIIKETKEFFFKQIKEAEEGLKELREKCDHPEKHIEVVDYMWAPGHISRDTKICGICGEVIAGLIWWLHRRGLGLIQIDLTFIIFLVAETYFLPLPARMSGAVLILSVFAVVEAIMRGEE